MHRDHCPLVLSLLGQEGILVSGGRVDLHLPVLQVGLGEVLRFFELMVHQPMLLQVFKGLPDSCILSRGSLYGA